MFIQDAPVLGNQFRDDDVLRNLIERRLETPPIEELDALGELAGGELFELQLETLDQEAGLTRWSAWGERIDQIDYPDTWLRAAEVARDYNLVGTAYRDDESNARLKQFAKVFLFAPSSDTYSCPLAMTDGAVRTLLESGNEDLIERAVPRLTGAEDPNWISGQWMTEAAGGSDVRRSKTTARHEDEQWRLYGRKWFTSAIGSEMALALARPEENDEGNLALFYVETRNDQDQPRNFRVTRLKDKLGTRELPTGEIILDGTPAKPVNGLNDGVQSIYPMLNVTRSWNAVCSAAAMRRGLAFAESYAQKREVFGDKLTDKPLHQEVMESLEAETQGALQLAFEAGDMLDSGGALRRVIIPLAKLYTAKQAALVASETIELFGGAGYVEDTGIPKMIRDMQVLPIWEGTTNVLSLEVLRQVADPSTAQMVLDWVERKQTSLGHSSAKTLADRAGTIISDSIEWIDDHLDDRETLERHARGVSFSLARSLEVILLAEQGDWDRDQDRETVVFQSAERLLENDPTLSESPVTSIGR